MKKISMVIPTYNEQDNVSSMANALINQFETFLKQYDYEIIFIDNDSQDSTRQIIRKLCFENKKIKAIFNAKNYGQFNSPFYGVLQATGDCAILMSADFQEPVELIPKLVEEWEKGYKLVLGQKSTSKENRLVYALRGVYYRFMKKHSNVNFLDQVTGFGLYDREFIEVLKQVDDTHPFMRGIIAEMGYKIKLIQFEQPLRRAGKSSNNFKTYYDAAVQGITSYTKTGIRLIVACGVVFSVASVATLVGCIIYKLLNWGTFDLLSYMLELVIFVTVSLLMLFVGIVGEYVLRINSYMQKRPIVIESERINF